MMSPLAGDSADDAQDKALRSRFLHEWSLSDNSQFSYQLAETQYIATELEMVTIHQSLG
jgi:hypothetical protein